METKKATTAIFIDKYHPKADGKCSVTIRVTYDRKKRYFPTPFTLTPEDFNKTQGEKPRNEFKALALQLREYERKANDIISKLPLFSWASFEKQYLTNRGTRDNIADALTEYADKLRADGRIGTAVSYECARNSLKEFSTKATFAEITPDFLKKYEKWMLGNGKSVTTIGIYLRSLRTIINNAIADGLITKDHYPFGKKRYEIPTGKNIKKALTINEIARIFSYKTDAGTNRDKAKDYWIFIYLCNGINVKDLCLLKYKNLEGDVLTFNRAKTARTKREVEPIRIMLISEAVAIIKKWGNKKKDGETYIFPELIKGITPEKERQLIQLLTHLINDHMKAISEDLELGINITTYSARHSFATILQRSGANISFISGALGHGDLKTTQNYLGGFEDESIRETTKALTAFPKSV